MALYKYVYDYDYDYGKTRMACLADGEKKIEDIFICFGATHERDRRTPGDGIYRAYAYASRGKNDNALIIELA